MHYGAKIMRDFYGAGLLIAWFLVISYEHYRVILVEDHVLKNGAKEDYVEAMDVGKIDS